MMAKIFINFNINPAYNNCSFILNGAFEDFYSLKIDELVSHYVGEEAIHSTTMQY